MNRRYGVFAASAATALVVAGLASPATAATSADYAVYSTGGTNAAANVVPALPEGLTYTKVSAGTTQTLYLRSDGTVVGAGANTNHSLDIPALPAGVTYTDVDATGDVTVLVRSDGKIVFASDPYAKPLHVPDLPTGVTYTKVFSGGSSVTALRSDGRAVMFKVYYDDRFLEPTTPSPTATPVPTSTATATASPTPTPSPTVAPVANPAPVYWERVTTDADYTTAAVSGSDYVLLMHRTGKVKAVDIRAVKTGTLPQISVPTLPKGMRYDSIDAGSVAVYVRSDGVAITDGTTTKGAISVPKLPKGIDYTKATAGDFTIALLRSDGRAVLSGYADAAGVTPSIVTLPKGWKYTALSDNASHLVASAAKLQAGETALTSISYVHRPTTVVHGASVTYKVKVFSMADPIGGQVKVTYKGKTIGLGTVGAGSVATISVSSVSMPTHARNKVGVAYLGFGSAKKSSSATKYVGYIRTKP